ncbi:MAG: cation:proton antiporter, partial [Odoribacter sp.]|nr:cation:proton antiporter [Odoribacter sp.]
VGMLVDVRTFANGWSALLVAVVMTVMATVSKFIAAWMTEKSFRLTRDEGRLLFGLSNAQAAATLAAVLIGYKVIIGVDAMGEPIRLLNEDVLNGTIIMILFTCTIASFATQRAAQNIAISEMSGDRIGEGDDEQERILISLSNTETVEELINLGIAVKSRRNKAQMVAVSIIKSDNTDRSAEKVSELLLEKAVKVAAAAEHHLVPVLRYDLNIVNGIRNVAKEHKITDIVLGLRTQKDISDTFLGKLTEEVLSKCATTTLAYRPMQPMSTVKRYVVVIPEHAEKEVGFPYWLISVWNMGKNLGAKFIFYGNSHVLDILRLVHAKHLIHAEFREFTDWGKFVDVSREMQDNDALVLVMSRPACPSYSRHMEYVPTYINKYFNTINCILVYPVQLGMGEEISTFRSISMINHIEGMDGLIQVLGRLFKKNK